MAFSCISLLSEYKHNRLSKVHVSSCFSNIYNRLVQDRMSYALHKVNYYANEDSSEKLEHELSEGRRRGKPS